MRKVRFSFLINIYHPVFITFVWTFLKCFIELKTSHYHWLKEETAIFASNFCNKCQLLMPIFFFGSSYFHEPLQYQHSADRHESCNGDGLSTSRALEMKMDYPFSWVSGMQIFKKAEAWLIFEVRLLPRQLQHVFLKLFTLYL